MKIEGSIAVTKEKVFKHFGIFGNNQLAIKLLDGRWVDYISKRYIPSKVIPIKKRVGFEMLNKLEKGKTEEWWHNNKHYYNGSNFKDIYEVFHLSRDAETNFVLIYCKGKVYYLDGYLHPNRLRLISPYTLKPCYITSFKNCCPVISGFKELNK